jgi:phosphoglycerate dehydrogenase-like enzyme
VRRLVVDLKSRAAAFCMPDVVGARLRADAPPGWETVIVQAETDSLGDGAPAPSAESLAAVREADVYLGYGMPPALFHAALNLRWVHTGTAGVAMMLRIPELRDGPCLLTNSAGVFGPPIAEHVLAGVLYLSRAFDVADALRAERRWDQSAFGTSAALVREIDELRVLVVGTGGLGASVASRFAALGARVVGLRRDAAKGCPPGFTRVSGLEAIDSELPQADVVVLAAALTDATRQVLDARRLALLPAGAIVVNVARGALVDEDALVAALVGGRLRGAVLDVFAHEPLAPESALWQLRQVVWTPHVSGVSPRRFWDRLAALFLENWHSYAEGRPLRNLVDKTLGY